MPFNYPVGYAVACSLYADTTNTVLATTPAQVVQIGCRALYCVAFDPVAGVRREWRHGFTIVPAANGRFDCTTRARLRTTPCNAPACTDFNVALQTDFYAGTLNTTVNGSGGITGFSGGGLVLARQHGIAGVSLASGECSFALHSTPHDDGLRFPFQSAFPTRGSALLGGLALAWQGGRWQFNAAVEDAGWPHWRALPRQDAALDSRTAATDADGFLIYRPLVQGQNTQPTTTRAAPAPSSRPSPRCRPASPKRLNAQRAGPSVFQSFVWREGARQRSDGAGAATQQHRGGDQQPGLGGGPGRTVFRRHRGRTARLIRPANRGVRAVLTPLSQRPCNAALGTMSGIHRPPWSNTAMTSTRSPLPALVALALAGALSAPGAARAADTTLSYSASFTASGGDARFGYGATADPTYNFVVYNLLPLFDPSLGVLERVSFRLDGWRSFDGVCSIAANAQAGGGCSARIDGAFYLDGLNLNTWPQEAAMASINPVTLNFSGAAPAVGSSVPINIYAGASASGEITNAAVLNTFFTASGNPTAHPQNGIRLRFSPQDGGYFGYGGSAGFSAMLWDADATASVTYHYTATVVPEPGSLALWLAGGAMMAGLARRRRSN